ncbi:MAG: YceD family protein [Anaerolineales bacterium]
MFLSVKQIERTGLRVERVVQAPAVNSRDGRILPFDPVSLSGMVTPRRGGYRFEGHLSTVGTLECSRCLEPFRHPVEGDFDLFFSEATPEADSPDEEQAREQAISFAPLKDGKIDLGALVSEQIYLGLPLKPLCGKDCLGLCAACGANRNLGACTCENRSGDPLSEPAPVARTRSGS